MPSHQPPLSIALCGLPAATAGDGAREQVPWARAAGFAAVQLNAAAPGVRPRDLDRSARRDLGAIIRREGLALSGVDLWVPPDHFSDPPQTDRAMSALQSAIEMAGEISLLVRGTNSAGGPPAVVSIAFPPALDEELLFVLAAAADRAGVRIADHTLPARAASERLEPAIGIGIDPASALSGGIDPAALASALGARLAAARLSDLSSTVGGGRAVPGSRGGRLDLLAYHIALTTADYKGFVCLDLRSVVGADGAQAAVKAWTSATLIP